MVGKGEEQMDLELEYEYTPIATLDPIKAYMKDDERLEIVVRSSMGGKFMLANTQGWIDSDYYENEDNDGNIGIFLKNISNKKILRFAEDFLFSYVII